VAITTWHIADCSIRRISFKNSIFADNDGDGSVEAQVEVIVQEGKAERIGRAVVDARGLEPNALEVRRRHIESSISSCGHAPESKYSTRSGALIPM
jgi:hypothetical protein